MTSSSDFTLDLGACTAMAVCSHCGMRMIRGEESLVIAEARSHLLTVHRDDPMALERVQTAIRRASARG